MLPTPFKFRVFIVPSRECKACPTFYFIRFRYSIIAVMWIDFHYSESLQLVATCFVIEHNIGIYHYAIIVKGVNAIVQLLLGSVFCANSPLLIKLTQVVQIISSISNIVRPCAFVARWNPNGSNTNLTKVRSIVF